MEVPSSRDLFASASYRVRSRLLNVKVLWTTEALTHSFELVWGENSF